jgi:acetolactate synthase-1/2/3 large subunit
MGYGLPAAIAAKRRHPDRTIIAFAGDGCFLMTGQEFATAVQESLPILVVVIDNRMYGTIRMHQERAFPGRVSATTLRNPDFAAYARAFGGFGARIERTDQFAPAYAEALASNLPAILHLLTDPDVITPAMRLSALRAKALAEAAGR